MQYSQDFNMNNDDISKLRIKLENKAIRRAKVNFVKKEKAGLTKKDSCLLSQTLLKKGVA